MSSAPPIQTNSPVARTATGLALCALLLPVLAACEPTSVFEANSIEGRVVEPLSDELAEVQTRPGSEYEEYVVDCVTAEGFDYLPLSGRADVEAELADDEREFREEYGYGFALALEERTLIQMRATAAAENADSRFHGMSEKLQLEYFGLVTECDERAFLSLGYSPVSLMSTMNEDWPDAEPKVREQVETDEEYLELAENWRSCMDDHAHDPGPPELVPLSLEEQAREFYDAYEAAGDVIVAQNAGTWQTFTAEGLLSEDDFAELEYQQWVERELADADLACRDEGYEPLALYNDLFTQFMIEELSLETK